MSESKSKQTTVPAPTPDQYPDWIARAAEHFSGDVVIGDDLTTITV